MPQIPVFPAEEYEARVERVRAAMAERGLDGVLVSSPENVFYLCGLDHMGYFAYQALVVPLAGALRVVARGMEQATMRDQIPHIELVGYSDGIAPVPAGTEDHDLVLAVRDEAGRVAGLRPWEASLGVQTRPTPAPQAPSPAAPVEATRDALERAGLAEGRVGIEKASTFLSFRLAEQLVEHTPGVEWVDASGLVDDCRLVQSPLEQQRTREAARVSDTMMLSGIAAAGPGVPPHDVMAAIYDAMFRRGGTYPGFVPLVRSTRTLEHEHGTWQSERLCEGDVLFLEMAGCIHRYHAPLGRLVHIGRPPAEAEDVLGVARDALDDVANAVGPGVRAADVYRAWQARVSGAGLGGYRRHHCGYSVGIGYPPSWSGSGVPVGLRPDSELELRAGMVFHLMSWLLRSGRGDAFLSDTALVTPTGCEILTRVSRDLCVR